MISFLKHFICRSILGTRSLTSISIRSRGHSRAANTTLLLRRLQYLEATHEGIINAHHGTRVIKLPTVIWRTEHRNQLLFGKELVPVLNDLMCSTDEVQVVLGEDSLDDIRAKDVRDAAVVAVPAVLLLVGVGPQEVAEEATVGDVGGAGDATDLVHGLEGGAQPAVHAEDLLVDDCGDGEAVETLSESAPEPHRVATLALLVEAVDAVDGRRLVVPAEKEEVLGVLDLVGEQKADCLDALFASVNIVAEEEIVGLGWVTAVVEKAEKVRVLPVDVAADLDRRLELEKNGLLHEDLAGRKS